MAEKRRRQQESAVSVGKGSKSKKISPTQSEYKSPRGKDNENIDVDVNLELNAGDLDLKPYLDPLLRNVGGSLKNLSQEQVNNGNATSIIECGGNKMWFALNSSHWKHREAAATAFMQYLEAAPAPRY